MANALRSMLAEGPAEGAEGLRARLPDVQATRRTQLDLEGDARAPTGRRG